MKRLVIISFLFYAFFSCKKENFQSQNEMLNEEFTSLIFPVDSCPEGTHPVLSYEFDGFNFHRPKYSCSSGFWFCFKSGHWEKICLPNDPKAQTKTNSTFVWGKIVGNKFEIHFPVDLQNKAGNSPQDFQIFSVDDEYEVYTNLKLAKGQYIVNVIGSEFVVLVNLL